MSKRKPTSRPVGAMVVTLAKAKGITLGEVADHIGAHRNSLTEKVARRRPFDEDEIILAAEKLGVPPGWLFEDPLVLLGISEAVSSAWSNRGPGHHLFSVAA